MAEAYIVDAVRTPVGKRAAGWPGPPGRPRGAHASARWSTAPASTPARSRTSCSAASTPSAGQAGDIARTCWLAAGLPEHVPGTTVDRQCGSAQQAVHFAAQAVMAGTNDVVVAGGVQKMSQIPISSAMTVAEPLGFDDPFSGSEGWVEALRRPGGQPVPGAEMIAEKWDISRDDMEAFAVESHERAHPGGPRAASSARSCRSPGSARRGARASPNWEKIRSLPTLVEGGRVTAAVRVADQRRLGGAADRHRAGAEGDHGLTPAGPHPPPVGAGRRPGLDADRPIPATAHALRSRA